MRRNHSLAILVVSISALILTGCSEDAENEPAAGCPDGVVTLEVLGLKGSIPTTDMLNAYQATNKCVKFNLTTVPFGQLAQKISVLAPSSNPPDILTFDGPDTQSYASQGLLLPLDEYLPKTWNSDVVSATKVENTWEGNVYSPGVIQDSLSLYYNKTMTDEAGITVPDTLESAWKWPEALTAFKKCQAANPGVDGLAPSRLGDGTPGFAYRDLLFLRSMGDPSAPKTSSLYKTYWSLSQDQTTAQGWLNTPEAISGAKFYQSLFQGADKVTSKSGRPNALIDQKACFDLDTTSASAAVADPKTLDFEVGISPVPYFKSPVVHTGSTQLGVPAKSKNKDVAAKAVVAMSTGDLLLEHAKSIDAIPNLKSLEEKIPELQELPMRIPVDEIQQWGHPRPPSPSFSQYNLIVTDALRNIAYGADPKSELDKAAKQLEPVLSTNK